MFDFETFLGLNYTEIGARYKYNPDRLIAELQRNNLLVVDPFCHCGQQMNSGQLSRSIDNHKGWRCPHRPCRNNHGLRKESFFEQSKLQLWQIMSLVHSWCQSAGSSRGLSYDHVMDEASIRGKATVVDWMQFCRDVAVENFLRHPCVIGGEGVIVQIDESLFARRKYNRGRVVVEQWIFGGWCDDSRTGFLVPVADRSAATLLPLIRRYIRPGSIIHSDMWQAYRGVQAMEDMDYNHRTVCHDRHFVDPQTGVHTNGVEGMWSCAKAKVKAMHGTNRSFIMEYCAEFMFKQRYRDDIAEAFWTNVVDQYPLNGQEIIEDEQINAILNR